MTGYQIRPANRSDFSDIARLQANSWRQAYRNDLPASYLSERVEADLADQWGRCKFKPKDVVLVARQSDNQTLLGFISVWCRPDAFIDNLHCDPARTSNGIGTALMRDAFTRLHDQGNRTATLSVLVGNDGAQRFYKRLGGQLDSVRREEIFGYPVDVQIMHWTSFPSRL